MVLDSHDRPEEAPVLRKRLRNRLRPGRRKHISTFRPRKEKMAALGSFQRTRTAYVSLRFVFIAVLLSIYGSAGAASTSNEGRPKDASGVLQQLEGRIVALRDLDREVVEHLRMTGGGETPGSIVADFDGDGIDDVAVLTKEPDGTQLALRVFLCASDCRQVSRVDLGEFEGLQYLTLVPASAKGKSGQSLAKSSQKVSNARIKYWVFGRSNVVYSWDRKARRLRSVTTGD